MNKKEKILKFCEIILNFLELRGWDKAKKEDGLPIPYEHYSLSIPYEHFKKEGLDNFDVFNIYTMLENKNILAEGHILVHSFDNAKSSDEQEKLNIKETVKYLGNNLVFTVWSLNELKKYYYELNSNIKPSSDQIKIYYHPDKGFYRQDKEYELAYKVRGPKIIKRLRILTNKGKQKINSLANELEQKDSKITQQRDEINNQFRKKLDLEGDIIIHARIGEMINPQYKIIFLDSDTDG